MDKKPEILECKELIKTRLFRVEEMKLRFSNGVERTYERLGRFNDSHQAVMIVPLVDNNHFLMIREYAAGMEEYQLSLPKGLVDAGETVFEGANRELKEEAGFGANNWRELTTLSLSPNYMHHTIRVVVATDLYKERLEGDEPEPLGIETLSFDQLLELNERCDFSEARVLAALYLVKDMLNNRAL
ncbi:MAG: ADP compounds hydrolase NudE [Endozoicomonas sp. (ex Botrylloides leachii)]|nr:ADP compounds hydrolase NudE [Endozoicomonas sp. (ex Botrylloides leachii)]